MHCYKTLFLSMCAASISACSTVGLGQKQAETAPPPPPKDELAPQRLAEGECGVFFWAGTGGRSGTQKFIFFHKQGVSAASLYHDNQTLSLIAPEIMANFDDQLHIDLEYKGAGYKSVRIKGNYADDIEGGRRISPASLTIDAEDGWQEIVPISGIFACQ